MIAISPRSFNLAVETTNEFMPSDYYLTNQNLTLKINNLTNWRFYVNAIIARSHYISQRVFTRTLSSLRFVAYETLNISARFINSNVSINRFYNITNGKNLF